MRTSISRLLPVTAAVALMLSACGGDDPTSEAIDPPDSTVASGGLRMPTPIQVTGGGSPGRLSAGTAQVAASEMAGDMATDMMIAPAYVVTDYLVSPDLPALPTNTTGYVFDAGAMPTAADAATIAAALGASGEPVEVDDGYGVHWRVGPDDGSAPSVTLWDDAMQSWNFDWGWAAHDQGMIECAAMAEPAPDVITESGTAESGVDIPVEAVPVPETTFVIDPCPMPEPPVGLPDAAGAEQRASDYLAAMGVDLATVTFDTYTDDWSASVTANEMIDGVSARSWGFSFGENASLQYAWGSAATPEAVGPYTLVDVDTAVARLADNRYGYMPFAAGIDVLADGDTAVASEDAPAIEPTIEPMPVDIAEGQPIEPEEITVTLVDVQADLWWVWDADGSAWLLPAYRFIGDDGGWYTVPAVTDDLLIVEPTPETFPVDTVIPETIPPVTTPPDVDPPVTTVPDVAPTVPPTTAPTAPPVTTPPTTVAEFVTTDFDDLVGLPLDEFTAQADARGAETRVVIRDFEGLAVTDDFRPSRVNIETVTTDGVEIVTSISSIG